ncbi:MAG: signal peptidase II [Armatimonadota bacterium]|nr:signal peptidase II [Armatimonadota bacterium]MDR7453431.1 signal peptidase II [Armatimonadota bacterium]MDR7457341.1 signal peptidase II [Armatimonadota bacterium]MDR7495657.1 signal peptidase II [Armatimonadota bacterium]
MLAGAAAVFVADQAAKAAVLAWVPMGTTRPILPGVLSLSPVANTGVAFGLLPGLPPVVAVLAALSLFAALLYNRSGRPGTRVWATGIALMVGGAAANLLDRLRLGYVIDYLDLHVWPVFNAADAAIVVGAGALVVALAREERRADSRR